MYFSLAGCLDFLSVRIRIYSYVASLGCVGTAGNGLLRRRGLGNFNLSANHPLVSLALSRFTSSVLSTVFLMYVSCWC